MTARTLMVQGTASSVGKSIVTAGLCRYFRRAGLRVAPFKSQNMALNAFVTPDGGEIGRAQAVQADAARVAPTVDMNPILLKMEGSSRSQLIVLGKSIGSLTPAEYHARRSELREVVCGALARLRASYDLVVIEGAGSPAEINLKDRDLVNMFIAKVAEAPVLLVGDIDRGGVFASLVGTLELLEPDERARIAAFVINKFRGDLSLLDSGLRMLEQRTGVPVLGVLPYLRDLRVADEDSVALEERRHRGRAHESEIEVAVVRLPRISNHDDFQPLEHEPGVVVRFVERAEELEGADLVVLPGSKTTCLDLAWLRESGMAAAVARRAAAGGRVLGICGGCQMLGESIEDPDAVESSVTAAEGLGLLPLRVRFGPEKRTAQVRAEALPGHWLASSGALAGYEIHMGRVERLGGARGAFAIRGRHGAAAADVDGGVSESGAVVGTMIHGLFQNAAIRETLVATLRRDRGLAHAPPRLAANAQAVDEYDRLADVLAANLDCDRLRRLVGL
jgi:adenosylcobyric acid synthase